MHTAMNVSIAPQPPLPPLLTVVEFHQYFESRIGTNTIYSLVSEGRIRSIRLGERKLLIPSSEVVDWPARETERWVS